RSTERGVRRRMGTVVQPFGLLSVWLARRPRMAAVQLDARALRNPEPHDRTHVTRGHRAYRRAPFPTHCVIHGLVRPARPRFHRAWLGLSRATIASSPRVHHSPCGDDDGFVQYFRAWPECPARYGTLFAQAQKSSSTRVRT